MLTMNSPLPPKLASSDTIEAMYALLAVIGNPELAKANLDALLAAKAAIDEATTQHDAAKKAADDAASALAGVQAQAADFEAREAALSAAQTALAVASSANVA